MPPEPLLEHRRLLRALSLNYGLDVSRLTYLDAGTAHAYGVEGQSGRYFVKVLPDNAYGQEMLHRVTAEVPLLKALREQNVLTRVPEVRPTLNSEALAWLDGFAVLVYGWLEARNVGEDWEASLPGLLPLLGRLHAGTPRLLPAVPRFPVSPEEFAFPFGPQLSRDLQTLRSAGHSKPAGVQALRDLLLPYQPRLHALLGQASAFQTLAWQQEHQFVVCHTDAHGGNVMRDASGHLWLIDWETARLAPPEHDLWMMARHLPVLLPTYEETLGRRVNLDLNTLSFYLCRRVLEDLAMDIQLILRANTRPEQDTANLTVIEKYILPDLNSLNERLEQLKFIPGLRI